MRSIAFVVLLLAAALVPVGTRAEDREWVEDYSSGWSGDRSDGYDVSVDLAVSGGVTFETFYEPLSPYGEWVVAGSYGRVWRPRVAVGWRPYYYGRWEWTSEGWLWVSDEPWGWAAYHYGRWAHDPYYGWIWVPGYEWAPAWVSWRVSGDVIGWAPLAPGLSVFVTTYPFIDFWWTFVPTVRFVAVPVYTVAFLPVHTRRWFHHTAPAPARPAPRPVPGRPAPAPAPAWGGPAPRLIAERTGRAVTPVRVVPAPAPGARARPGEVPVFRPDARPSPTERGRGRGPEAAPAPGRGPEGGFSPPPAGEGRGPGVAPAPGWPGRGRDDRGGGRDERAAQPRSEPRGAAPSVAPAPSREDRGGGRERGDRGGGDRGDNGGGRRGGRGDERGSPAPHRGR